MKNGPYELVIAPDQYPGKRYRGRYSYEHHVIWWKTHGFVPPKGYEIHHLNGDHRDNRVENLKLLTAKEHRDVHAALVKKPKMVLNCYHCSNNFELAERNYKYWKKRGRVRFHCSRRCAGKSGKIQG